jgi:hypothetical protein
VDGRYGAFLGIDEKNGHAVRGLDSEEEAGMVRDRGVALAWFVGSRIEEMDYVGVDLFEGDEFEIVRAESELKAAAIFEDVFASVPIREAEV